MVAHASIMPEGDVQAVGSPHRTAAPRLPQNQLPVVEPWTRLPEDDVAAGQHWRSLNLSLLAGNTQLEKRIRRASSKNTTYNATRVLALKAARLPAGASFNGSGNLSHNGSDNASQYPDDAYPYGEPGYGVDGMGIPDVENEYGKNAFGTGLLTELHLPHVTLRQLHTKSKGSLARFLLDLRKELSSATSVEEERLNIIGIQGQYQRMDAIDGDEPVRVNEEVLVRMELMDPESKEEKKPLDVITKIRDELLPGGALTKGPLKDQLTNATINLSSATTLSAQHIEAERRGAARLSAMALPIGISAAFTGILIWLAAW